MNKVILLLISGVLVLGSVACSDKAKTSQNSPNSTDSVGPVPDDKTKLANQTDAASDLRRKQLDVDIRAREQRNNVTGGDTQRAAADLASEVRSKLEANLPASQLTIEAKEGVVTIAGTIPTQQQLDRIEPLAKQIKGVQVVKVNVKVTPA